MPPYGLHMTHSARVLTANAVLDQLMASVGVDVIYLPYTVHTSSTRLRQALDLLLLEVAP